MDETKNLKLASLNLAKKELKRELVKAEKNVNKHSRALGEVDFSESTLKGRARLRMNLDIACEARDIVQRQLDFTKNWMEEIRNA